MSSSSSVANALQPCQHLSCKLRVNLHWHRRQLLAHAALQAVETCKRLLNVAAVALQQPCVPRKLLGSCIRLELQQQRVIVLQPLQYQLFLQVCGCSGCCCSACGLGVRLLRGLLLFFGQQLLLLLLLLCHSGLRLHVCCQLVVAVLLLLLLLL
jgi:hypothetical protein